MPIRLLVAACFLGSACLSSGCLSTSFPLTGPDAALPVDERLLGEWEHAGNGLEFMTLSAAGPAEYDILYQCIGEEDICEIHPSEVRASGWMTEIAGQTWMSVIGRDCEDEDSATCTTFLHALILVMDENTVHVAYLIEEAAGVATSSERLREALTGEIGDYLTEVDVYHRLN